MTDAMRFQHIEVAPPGWYADPARCGAHRYFDGVRFTQHIATTDGAVVIDESPPPGGGPVFPPATYGSPPQAVPAASAKRPLGFLPAWRPMTYVIVAFNVLMLVWMMNVSSGAKAGHSAAAGAADIMILFLTAIGDVILGVLFLVTRPQRRN